MKQKQSDAAPMRIAMPPIRGDHNNSSITSFVSTPTRSGSRVGFGASQTHQYHHSAYRFTDDFEFLIGEEIVLAPGHKQRKRR